MPPTDHASWLPGQSYPGYPLSWMVSVDGYNLGVWGLKPTPNKLIWMILFAIAKAFHLKHAKHFSKTSLFWDFYSRKKGWEVSAFNIYWCCKFILAPEMKQIFGAFILAIKKNLKHLPWARIHRRRATINRHGRQASRHQGKQGWRLNGCGKVG